MLLANASALIDDIHGSESCSSSFQPASKRCRRPRCGVCTGCQAKSCGECKYCHDKIDGVNSFKRPCVRRFCTALEKSPPRERKRSRIDSGLIAAVPMEPVSSSTTITTSRVYPPKARVSFPPVQVAPASDLASQNCGSCVGCLKQDCGRCVYCIDRKYLSSQRFGSSRCKERVCLQYRSSLPCLAAGTATRSPVRDLQLKAAPRYDSLGFYDEPEELTESWTGVAVVDEGAHEELPRPAPPEIKETVKNLARKPSYVKREPKKKDAGLTQRKAKKADKITPQPKRGRGRPRKSVEPVQVQSTPKAAHSSGFYSSESDANDGISDLDEIDRRAIRALQSGTLSRPQKAVSRSHQNGRRMNAKLNVRFSSSKQLVATPTSQSEEADQANSVLQRAFQRIFQTADKEADPTLDAGKQLTSKRHHRFPPSSLLRSVYATEAVDPKPKAVIAQTLDAYVGEQGGPSGLIVTIDGNEVDDKFAIRKKSNVVSVDAIPRGNRCITTAGASGLFAATATAHLNHSALATSSLHQLVPSMKPGFSQSQLLPIVISPQKATISAAVSVSDRNPQVVLTRIGTSSANQQTLAPKGITVYASATPRVPTGSFSQQQFARPWQLCATQQQQMQQRPQISAQSAAAFAAFGALTGSLGFAPSQAAPSAITVSPSAFQLPASHQHSQSVVYIGFDPNTLQHFANTQKQ